MQTLSTRNSPQNKTLTFVGNCQLLLEIGVAKLADIDEAGNELVLQHPLDERDALVQVGQLHLVGPPVTVACSCCVDLRKENKGRLT